jgi:hypothetical protein
MFPTGKEPYLPQLQALMAFALSPSTPFPRLWTATPRFCGSPIANEAILALPSAPPWRRYTGNIGHQSQHFQPGRLDRQVPLASTTAASLLVGSLLQLIFDEFQL